MPDNKKRYTLADLRLAYADGAAKWGAYRDHAEEEAARAFPDPEPPEPERRWARVSDYDEYARTDDGRWMHRPANRAMGGECESALVTDRYVRALASLLPREPVTVDLDNLTDRFMGEARFKATQGGEGLAMAWRTARAALEAVAADLAQPAAQPPKPQWWGVVRTDGSDAWSMYRSAEKAKNVMQAFAPAARGKYHKVALAEVPDVSDTEAQR